MFTLFTTRCLHVRHDVRDPSGRSGQVCCPVILPKWWLPRHLGIFYMPQIYGHGTDGFTSPPKEGVLRIFSPLKIRRLRPGLNPRTLVPKASMLPLDHRSCYNNNIIIKISIHKHVGVRLSSALLQFRRLFLWNQVGIEVQKRCPASRSQASARVCTFVTLIYQIWHAPCLQGN